MENTQTTTKPQSRDFKKERQKKNDFKKKGQKPKKPKWIWSNRDYPTIVKTLEGMFPGMRRHSYLETCQINEIAASKHVVFNIDDLNAIKFSFSGKKQKIVALEFDNPMKAAIWASRRLELLQKIDPKHKNRRLEQAWKMLEFFYNKLEAATKPKAQDSEDTDLILCLLNRSRLV